MGEGFVPRGPLSLNLEVVAEVFRRVFEGIRRHIGVRDAGGAGGDRHDFLGGRLLGCTRFCGVGLCRCGLSGCAYTRLLRVRCCRVGGGGSLLRGAGAERIVYEVYDFFGGLCLTQGGGEALLHQRTCQRGKQFQVFLVGTIGGGDEEDQIGRTVFRAEAHAGVGACHREGGFGDRRASAVGNGDAARDAGVGLGLAGFSSGVQLIVVGGT